MAIKYLEANCIKNIRVPTGVKYAHPVTSQYVIGANDEPNGHGTIQVKWDELNKALVGKEEDPAAKRLVGVLKMANLAVGDAICNFLMIESVLCDKDFTIENFANLYKDLPNQTLKVKVADRTAFKTTWDESRLIQPEKLQETIDARVHEVNTGRCFVRPSGTEDVLRVYVEAKTKEDCDYLAQ